MLSPASADASLSHTGLPSGGGGSNLPSPFADVLAAASPEPLPGEARPSVQGSSPDEAGIQGVQRAPVPSRHSTTPDVRLGSSISATSPLPNEPRGVAEREEQPLVFGSVPVASTGMSGEELVLKKGGAPTEEITSDEEEPPHEGTRAAEAPTVVPLETLPASLLARQKAPVAEQEVALASGDGVKASVLASRNQIERAPERGGGLDDLADSGSSREVMPEGVEEGSPRTSDSARPSEEPPRRSHQATPLISPSASVSAQAPADLAEDLVETDTPTSRTSRHVAPPPPGGLDDVVRSSNSRQGESSHEELPSVVPVRAGGEAVEEKRLTLEQVKPYATAPSEHPTDPPQEEKAGSEATPKMGPLQDGHSRSDQPLPQRVRPAERTSEPMAQERHAEREALPVRDGANPVGSPHGREHAVVEADVHVPLERQRPGASAQRTELSLPTGVQTQRIAHRGLSSLERQPARPVHLSMTTPPAGTSVPAGKGRTEGRPEGEQDGLPEERSLSGTSMAEGVSARAQPLEEGLVASLENVPARRSRSTSRPKREGGMASPQPIPDSVTEEPSDVIGPLARPLQNGRFSAEAAHPEEASPAEEALAVSELAGELSDLSPLAEKLIQEEFLTEAVPGAEVVGETADQGDVAQGLPPALSSTEVAVEEEVTGPRTAGSMPRTQGAVQAEWMRAALDRVADVKREGWDVLEMTLDGGDGTVTVEARREEDRVAVAVGFSDPSLRALASAHADRIQEALQAEFGSEVDLSFSKEGASQQEERHAFRQAESRSARPAPSHANAAAATEPLSARGPRSDGHREWVV